MRVQRPWLMVGLIFGLVAIVAVACSGDDDVATGGLTAAEIQSAVQAAVAGADSGPTAEQIGALVADAVAGAVFIPALFIPRVI